MRGRERRRIEIAHLVLLQAAERGAHDFALVVVASAFHHAPDERFVLFGQCVCHAKKLPTNANKSRGGMDEDELTERGLE